MRFSNMITAVDAHACGEPGRVITGGVLDMPGGTMFEKMQWMEQNADHIRQRMLREPRGYPALCCNVIMPPPPILKRTQALSSWSRLTIRRCPAATRFV